MSLVSCDSRKFDASSPLTEMMQKLNSAVIFSFTAEAACVALWFSVST